METILEEYLTYLNMITEYRRRPVSGPKKVDSYFKDCMKQKNPSKEKCARIAWNIFCSHTKPGYKGCTKYGRTWGRPYSSPIKRK